jgi:LacI family transcriptional regulator, fructose operon transcriptional repressor
LASIKDVALQAGVSTTTVSRVLGNPDAVRPALRDRVQQAITDLAYRPNLAARRLRQQRASLIGLIVSDIRNPFFTDISRAVEDLAFRHGLRLILCNSDEDPAKEQVYLDLMADEQASGVILSATLERLKRPKLDGLPFPVVMVDRAPEALGGRATCDVVQLDNHDAAHRLTRHLLDGGHRRILALAGSRSGTGRERQAGHEAAMRAAGLTPWVLPLLPTAAAAVQALQGVLAGQDRPEAVIATNGLLLLGAVQALQAAGLAWPRDVAVAGFDNNDWTALPQPAITVVAQPTHEIGRTATELLLQRIAEPERPSRRIVLEGELIVRGSSGPRG